MSNVYYSKYHVNYFKYIFSINFYVRKLHRIAALICKSVLVVHQSRESADVVQIVSKSKLSRWLRAKSRADAVRLFPICTVREIVSAKVRI